MSLEYFTFGYKEFHEGALIRLEPFCEPHDEHMLDHVRALMPDLIADPTKGACVIQINLDTHDVSIVGGVRSPSAREHAHRIALEGALTLDAVDTILEILRRELAESTGTILEDLGLAERMELVRALGDPDRPRAITLSKNVPFYLHASTRAKETVDSILAALISDTPNFPRA